MTNSNSLKHYMDNFLGIVVYEIIENASKIILNGIYTNNGDGGKHDRMCEINNEIAIKNVHPILENDILLGDYELRYIDTRLVNGKLIIKKNNEVYFLEWWVNIKKKPVKLFEGMGIKAGKNHLAVSYSHEVLPYKKNQVHPS
jgi:hypothetical protein